MGNTIGTVGVSNREVAAQRPQVSNQFSKLTDAIGLLGGGFKKAADNVEAELKRNKRTADLANARALKADDARINADFIKFQGDEGRRALERKKEMAANGNGYFESEAAYYEQRTNEFLETVPEDLKPKYQQKLQSIVEGGKNNAFVGQMAAQDDAFKNGLGDIASQAYDSIINGTERMEDWEQRLEETFGNSTLSEAENNDLRDTLVKSLEKAQFIYDVKVEAGTDHSAIGTTGAVADGSNVVASGLPAGAAPLLNAIAGVESPDYATMYGGGKFTDFSKHPNKRVLITSGPNKGKYSTAAGRYQFIKSTWDAAANALGLTDFSPESQDRAAWWLAQRDYLRKSGRDISADLKSGDPALVDLVRKTLGGSGTNVTWEGLQHLSASKFFSSVSGDKGTPSALIHDPAYSNLTISEKMKISEEAIVQADAVRANTIAEQLKQVAGQVNDLTLQITAGEAGIVEINSIIENNPELSIKQRNQLQNAYQAANKETIEYSQFVSKLNTPGKVFGGAEDRRGVEALFQRSGGEAAMAEDFNAFAGDTLIPTFNATGMVAEGARKYLETALKANDPSVVKDALAAGAAMSQIDEQNYKKAFGEDFESKVEFYKKYNGLVDEASFMERMNAGTDLQAQPQIKAELKTIFKDKVRSFKARAINRALGNGELDGLTNVALEGDFRDLYIFEYPKYRNHSDTVEAVTVRMGRVWGVSDLAGGALVKNPVEKTNPLFDGGHDYVNDQLKDTFGEGDFQLVPNNFTDLASETGEPVAHQVMKLNDFGQYEPVLNEKGYPTMFRPDVADFMREKEMDSVVLQTEVKNLNDQINDIELELRYIIRDTKEEGMHYRFSESGDDLIFDVESEGAEANERDLPDFKAAAELWEELKVLNNERRKAKFKDKLLDNY